ncbi:MAG: ribosome small subunit-dependent GTPase A [Deltaproteobacteria bacterium]|nr:ribosome small subunit-dependent GTPase A [Deltaproteobacteria bacterium]
MYELSTLGFSPFFKKQIENENVIPARIISEHKGGYQVQSTEASGLAQLSGRLKRELDIESFPGVGDWVILRTLPSADNACIIDRILERSTLFTRGAPGKPSHGQVIAANVDTVFIVCGLDNDYNLRRIERYLARVWASGAQPVVILNKSDICDDVDSRIDETASVSIGAEVIATSATTNQGIDDLKSFILPGKTTAFVGSSGAGKSSLINTVSGEKLLATGEIRHSDGRGRHTTTSRQLLILPRGGILIDTPGMRELQLFDENGINTVFSEIETLSKFCRFNDCSHNGEPGCAVSEALENGELSQERFENYIKMRRESQAYELRHDEHRRRKSERIWGQLYDEGKMIRKLKGDD